MAKNTLIRTLPAEEQEALALCGITQDAQLARVGPHALLDDLRTAAALFPESLEKLPDFERLNYLCHQAAKTANLQAEDTAQLWQGKVHDPSYGASGTEGGTGRSRRVSAATGRVLVADAMDTKQAKALGEHLTWEDPHGFSHAIRCQHPIATYLGAWATLFLVISVVVLLLGIVGLLIGIEYKDVGIPMAIALASTFIFYAILLGLATCSTCRVGIFSFRRYPRHRKAHRFPFLGYTLSTALYIIFLFRYRCPSCGTTQNLFAKRHRKR